MPDDDDSVASVYMLTPLTRDAGQSRRVIVQGLDVPWRSVIIVGSALMLAIIPVAFLWLFVGQMALLVIPIFVGAAFYLVERRTRSGLRLRTYQAALDKRRAVVNVFLCCGVAVDPSLNSVRLLKSSSAPAIAVEDIDMIDIAMTGSVKSARQSRHEPLVISVRRKKPPRTTPVEPMFAPSGHESFWSDGGVSAINDDAEFDIDAAFPFGTPHTKPRSSPKSVERSSRHSQRNRSAL